MTIESRLKDVYRYRDEAMKDPKANKLYLEDLALSIPMFEQMVKQPNKEISVLNGFPIDD